MIIITLLIWVTTQGTIKYKNIELSNSNRYEFSDYTFTMIPSTSIPSGGSIEIIFPPQYLSGLGIDLVQDSTCSISCSINEFTLTFNLNEEILGNIELQLSIKDVKNPERKGGTGNFKIRSRLGQNIFDENLIFGTIGIGDYALDLNSMIIKIDEQSTNVVGQQALYNFYIKSPILLPTNFYIRIIPPLISDLSTCKLIPYNGTTLIKDISCSDNIIIKFTEQIPALFTFVIQINFINPPYAQITNTFTVGAYRKDTTLIYAWRKQIQGVNIIAGTLKDGILKAESDMCAQVVTYQLQFTTFNIIPNNGGSIKVILPKNYELVYKTTYDQILVVQGIISSQLIINYNLYQFELSGFEEIKPNTIIQIQFRGTNPQISGTSDQFIVQTLMSGYLIDQQFFTLLSKEATSLLPILAVLSQPYAKASTNFQFQLTPNKLTAKTIIIDFGIHFNLTTLTNSNCLSSGVISISCTATDNIVTFVSALTLSSTMLISFNSFLINANTSRDAFIYFYTLDTSNNPVEYGTIQFISLPEIDVTSVFTLLGKELSTTLNPKYSTLIIQFTPINEIPDNVVTITPPDTTTTTTTTTDPDSTTPPTDPDTTTTTDPDTTTEPIIETTEPPTPHGEIWIQFGPSLSWDSSLGMTKAYCVTDLIPIDGMEIQCDLVVSTSIPEIKIKNFKAIPASQAINIRIPNLLNPQVASITITIYGGTRQFVSRIPTTYATSSLTLSAQGPATWNSLTSSFTLTSTTVNTQFQTSFIPGFTVSIPAGNTIRLQLPTYGQGFLQNTTSCQVDSNAMPCILYVGLDWIEIKVNTTITAPGNKITLLNLKWPITSGSIGFLKWISFNNNLEQEKGSLAQLDNSFFPAPSPNDFLVATILSYQVGRGYAGQIFLFNFQIANQVPDNSVLKIEFPNEFETGSIKCNGYGNTQIILKNINLDFNVSCEGINTPFNPPDLISDGWNVEIYSDGRLLNQRLNFFYYNYDNLFSQGTINILKLSASPQNVNRLAIYTIRFQLENHLLEQSLIQITFPSSNFDELPYPPNLADCSLQESLNSFETCLLDGSTFNIILNTKYLGGVIEFSINNVLNPSVRISDGFTIKTYYNKILIDSTDESTLLNRTITYDQEPLPLIINSIEFSPQNQGVKSTYTFNLTLDVTLETRELVITFPVTYDQRLGDNLKGTLNGVVIPINVNQRQLIVAAGNYGYQIQLIIKNIVNPNVEQNSGEFRIGIRENEKYIYYNQSAGVLEMLDPPGWLYLENIKLSNTYSRWQSQYTFIITLYNKLPDYLLMDFPSEYELSDITTFCNFKLCTFNDNVLKAYNDPINGNITFTVNVENPLNEITVNNYNLFSSNDRQIVEQSYKNLDPFSFDFKYSGPLIYINNDQDIIAYQGTETEDLIFRVNYPQALNLTFKHAQTGSFTVLPKDLLFYYTTLISSFRIQIPTIIPTGIYYIYWNTFGEKNPPFYTPVKKSRVIIKQSIIKITVSTFYPIPLGGNSLPITVSIPQAPYDGMNIIVKSNDKTVYLVTDSSSGQEITLTFTVGINSLKFWVFQNYTELIQQQLSDSLSEEDRVISFTHNNALYQSIPNLIVTLIDSITTIPVLTSLEIQDIKMVSAKLHFKTNQLVEVFYMYALNKTKTPELSELLNSGPPLHITTLSKYGYGLINLEGDIKLNLQSKTDYCLYIVLRNQGYKYSEIYQYNFTTLDNYPIAEFNVQNSGNYQTVDLIKQIAFVLSLPTWKVVEKVVYISNETRLLQSSTLNLQIIPFNDTDIYPSPNELVNKLIRELPLYQAYLSGINIYGGKLSSSIIPNITQVNIHQSYLYDCEISATLDLQGNIFAVASQKNVSTPYQIFKGLDEVNQKIPSGNHQVLTLNSQNFNISNLEPNNTYSIYLIATSDLPEYPQLSDSVSTLTCTTKQLEDRMSLIILGQNILKMIVTLLYICY